MARPSGNAAMIASLWNSHKHGMRVLDFGGGNDMLCSALRASGFREAVTYDPMVPEHADKPHGKFDLVIRQALSLAWARHGYKNASLNDGVHLAFREVPKHWGLAVAQ